MEKLAFAFGTLIVGVMLAITGFVESVNGAPVAQAQSAVLGIAFTYVAINVMVYLVSVVSVRRLARLSAAPAT